MASVNWPGRSIVKMMSGWTGLRRLLMKRGRLKENVVSVTIICRDVSSSRPETAISSRSWSTKARAILPSGSSTGTELCAREWIIPNEVKLAQSLSWPQ